MLGSGALATARNSKRSLRRNVQNKTKLVLELFGEPAAHKAVENRANDPRALRLRQPAMLEASRHHRSRPAMPQTRGLHLDKRNTLLYSIRIIGEQAVTQRDQRSLIERLETGCLYFHRDDWRNAPNVQSSGTRDQ